jgi:hypothetical protein
MTRWWLCHHVKQFSHGIVIDYASTDNTVALVHELAPTWEVRQSRNSDFGAVACDTEVMEIEREISDWKIVLTTTEFLYCNNLPTLLSNIESQGLNGAKIRPVAMVDMAERHDIDSNVPLEQQCHTGFLGGFMEPYKSRLIHRHVDGAYSIGRHYTGHTDIVQYPEGALLLWFGYAPWTPQTRQRKLQIQQRIPEADKQRGLGVHHVMDESALYVSWQEMVQQSSDLRQLPEYAAVVGS